MIVKLKHDPFSIKYWEDSLKKKYDLTTVKNNIIRKEKSSFNPYQNNGGTIIAMTSRNFCIIACDTRFTSGFAIPSREIVRVYKLSSKIILGSAGMFSDIKFLQNKIKNDIESFENENMDTISLNACAHYISSLLYSRRFFPFYTFNLLTGLENDGKGYCYSYDAIGSFEKNIFGSVGQGQAMADAILDSKITCDKKMPLFEQLLFLKKIFLSISSRGISIGDGLQIFILSKKGIVIENNVLKQD